MEKCLRTEERSGLEPFGIDPLYSIFPVSEIGLASDFHPEAGMGMSNFLARVKVV